MTLIILVFAKNCIREDDNENVVADEKDDNEVC